MKPVGHRLLIKPDNLEEVTKGGIFIPDTVRDKERHQTHSGEVVDIGPTAWMTEALGKTPWVKIGDRVVFAKYGGKTVKHPDTKEEYVFINDEDILGII